jgi:hypothetical protein
MEAEGSAKSYYGYVTKQDSALILTLQTMESIGPRSKYMKHLPPPNHQLKAFEIGLLDRELQDLALCTRTTRPG